MSSICMAAAPTELRAVQDDAAGSPETDRLEEHCSLEREEACVKRPKHDRLRAETAPGLPDLLPALSSHMPTYL